MKRKVIKKTKAWLLVAALITSLLHTGIKPMTVHAAPTIKTMNFDTSYLAPSDGTWDATNDHKVYYGRTYPTIEHPTTYSVLFRVLKADENTMLLDCDGTLTDKSFGSDNQENSWNKSDLKSWINDFVGERGLAMAFTSIERDAILSTTHQPATNYTIGDCIYTDELTTDYLFLLSADEANKLYADNNARKKYGHCHWWLRSTCVYSFGDATANRIGSVWNGTFSSAEVTSGVVGLSPAFNMDLSNVLFTSAYALDKTSQLQPVTEASNTKEWKLTMLDTSKKVNVTYGQKVIKCGEKVTVPYTYPAGIEFNQISVMITNGAYDADGTEILYYGKLQDDVLYKKEKGYFIMPSGLPDGYKVYILAEVANKWEYTDYASKPVEITIEEKVETPIADLKGTTYNESESLTLTSPTEGADIYYNMTTDGTDPADPTTASTAYKGAISLMGTLGKSETYKIKAMAVKSGFLDSDIATFTYTIDIPEATYETAVINGIGGGSYKAGDTVTITADEAKSGKQFKEWTGVEGLTFVDNTNKTSKTAKFTMPANNVTVTATYEDIPVIDDTVAPSIIKHPQSVSVKEGESAAFDVAATGTAPLAYQWMVNRNDGKGWVNINKATSTTYTTSATDMACNGFKHKCVVSNTKGSVESNTATLTVTNNSVPETSYEVTVTNGTGGGSYKAGDTVTIKADAAKSGKQFKEWTGVEGLTFVDNTNKTSKTAKFTMPANNVTVTATYEDIPVIDDTVAPSIIKHPQSVSVKEGESAAFDVAATGTAPLAYQWMVNRNDGKGWVNINKATSTTYTTSATDMACNGFKHKCVVSNTKGSVESNTATLTVTNNSVPETSYEVTVTNGTGGGSYKAGDMVTITADEAESGKQFKEWTGVEGLTFVDNTNKASKTAKFTMPGNNVTVTATYEDIPVGDDTVAPSITTQPQSVSVKEGESATFSITPTGIAPLSYQWMINRNDGKGWVNISNATSNTYTTSATDMDCNGFNYKCIVSNKNGSVESDVVTLVVTNVSANEENQGVTDTDKNTDDTNNGSKDTNKNTNTNKDKKDELPNTGDDIPVVWMFVLMFGSGTTLYFASKKKEVRK